LIITALEREFETVDQHITDAQEEHKKIETTALRLAHDALEEKWNEAAQMLLDVGRKFYSAGGMIDRDPVSFFKLDIPEQGKNFGSWK
jgi:Na+/phosphate symporter